MKSLERRSKAGVTMTAIAVAACVGWIDVVTGMEVSVALLYLIPVVITAWYVGRWMGFLVSVQCAAEGFLAEVGHLSYSYAAIPYWNAAMMLGFYVAVTLLLVALKASLRKEAELARRIQQNFLPGTLDVSPVTEIAAAWRPSLEVGGDYFDVFPLDEACIAICIADVSGHGMPAALLMSSIQSAVRLLATQVADPTEMCARLNALVADSFPDGGFLTCLFGILDTTTGRITYSNAGHNPPVIVRSNGAVDVLRNGSVPLGIVHPWSFGREAAALQPGDILFLYTDGLTEARNDAGDLFGEERLLDTLCRNRTRGPEQIKRSVLAAVDAFRRGNIEDDITMLCIAYMPGAKPPSLGPAPQDSHRAKAVDQRPMTPTGAGDGPDRPPSGSPDWHTGSLE